MRRLFALLVLFSSASAFAHAHLTKSDPAQGASLTQLPDHVTLRFSEALEPSLCKVTIKFQGQALSVSAPESVDPQTLRVPLPAHQPENGTYEVDWKVVSKDTHKMSGSFQFSISEHTAGK